MRTEDVEGAFAAAVLDAAGPEFARRGYRYVIQACRGTDGSAVFADESDPLGMSAMFRSFIAGQLATLRELTLLYAPNINSYKRFADGSFAPTAIA